MISLAPPLSLICLHFADIITEANFFFIKVEIYLNVYSKYKE